MNKYRVMSSFYAIMFLGQNILAMEERICESGSDKVRPLNRAPSIADRNLPSQLKLPSNEGLVKPALKTGKKCLEKSKSTKKRKSDFRYRKGLYLVDYYTSLMDVIPTPCASSISSDLGDAQFSKLRAAPNRDILNGYLRESSFFEGEYKLLKGVIEENLGADLEMMRNHDLAFLQSTAWMSVFEPACAAKLSELKELNGSDGQPQTISLSEYDIQNILEMLSSQVRYKHYQQQFVDFLNGHILKVAQKAPESVRYFFCKLYLSMHEILGEETSLELVTNNFILYIINPFLNKIKTYDLIFTDDDLLAFEKAELEKLKESDIKKTFRIGSQEERALTERVVKQMKDTKRAHDVKMWRESRNFMLVKLIQKTFMEEGVFQSTDYADFRGQFYIMLGKKNSELNQQLTAFKKELQKAIFGDFLNK